LFKYRILRPKGEPEEAAPGQELRLSLLPFLPRSYEALYSDRRAEEVKKWIIENVEVNGKQEEINIMLAAVIIAVISAANVIPSEVITN
jgi:hypothetical protein